MVNCISGETYNQGFSKYLSEGKDLFSLAYRLYSVIERSQHRISGQELEAETKEDQSLLAPGLTSATFLPKDGATHSALGRPT